MRYNPRVKKIINGRTYSTETAHEVGAWDNGRGSSCADSDYEWGALYRKRTGEYFVYGEGGAHTRYAESVGASWGAGWRISPVSYADAVKWAEGHLTAEEYEKEFGAAPEGDGTVQVGVRLAAPLAAKLESAVRQTGKTKTEIISELLDRM